MEWLDLRIVMLGIVIMGLMLRVCTVSEKVDSLRKELHLRITEALSVERENRVLKESNERLSNKLGDLHLIIAVESMGVSMDEDDTDLRKKLTKADNKLLQAEERNKELEKRLDMYIGRGRWDSPTKGVVNDDSL